MQEGGRLKRAHREAEAAFDIAHAEFRVKIGVIQKSEYDRLRRFSFAIMAER